MRPVVVVGRGVGFEGGGRFVELGVDIEWQMTLRTQRHVQNWDFAMIEDESMSFDQDGSVIQVV